MRYSNDTLLADCLRLGSGTHYTALGDSLSDRVSAGARISLQTSCGPGWLAQDGRCLVTKEGWAVIRTSGVGVTRGGSDMVDQVFGGRLRLSGDS